MIPYTLLSVTLLIALLSLSSLWSSVRRRDRHSGWLSVAMAVFIYLYGGWVFLSVWLKFVFLIVYVSIAIVAARSQTIPTTRSRKIVNVLFGLLFSILCVLYFTGTTGRPPGVANLALPFKTGSYYVFQGGNGLPTNLFHYHLRGAVFAIDIVKLNRWGNRANRIFSKNLNDYAIYNDTIYSPCSGFIAHTSDNNPDNIPPTLKRGPTNTNHVLIETDSMYVFLAHLRLHSVFVKAGQSVSTGQPLGLAGNSGFSIEPHLHIQAHQNTHTGLPWYREKQLQLTFNGRKYLLFQMMDSAAQ